MILLHPLVNLFLDQPSKGLPKQTGLMPQVSTRDLLLFRMRCQPTDPFGKQFFQFIVAHEVVFVVVEDRDEDVQVRQQFRNRLVSTDRHREIGTLAPFGELLIERMTCGLDGVTQRFEHAVQKVVATSHRQDIDPSSQRNGRATNSGRSLHRPAMALPNTCEIATLMKDEAT